MVKVVALMATKAQVVTTTACRPALRPAMVVMATILRPVRLRATHHLNNKLSSVRVNDKAAGWQNPGVKASPPLLFCYLLKVGG
jgi:hypothetical protein